MKPIYSETSFVFNIANIKSYLYQLWFGDKKKFLIFLVVLDVCAFSKLFALSNLIEFIMAIMVLTSAQIRRNFVHAVSRFRVPKYIVAFLSLVLLSFFWSEQHLVLQIEELVSWRKMLLYIVVLSLYLDINDVDRALFSFLLISLIYCSISFFYLFTGIDPAINPGAILENHSTQPAIFSLCGFFAICKAITEPSVRNRVFLFCLGFVFLANVILLGTGKSGLVVYVIGAFLTVLFGVSRTFHMSQSNKSIVLIKSFLVSSVVAVFAFGFTRFGLERVEIAMIDLLATINGEGYMSSTSIRWVMWAGALEIWLNNFWLGVGAGSFELAYGIIASSNDSWSGVNSDDPHQQYLHIAATYGLAGLAAILAILVSIVRELLSLRFSSYAVIAWLIVISWSVNCLWNGHLATFSEGRVFWLILPILIRGAYLASKPTS